MKRETLWAIEKVYWDENKQLSVRTVVDEYDLYASKEAAQEECDKYNNSTVEKICSFYFFYVRSQVLKWLAQDRDKKPSPLEIAGANSINHFEANPYYYPAEVTITIYD